MRFLYKRFFWIEYVKSDGFSLGIHLTWHGRIDIHFLSWVLSIGNVPIYGRDGKVWAVANSYHSNRSKHLPYPRVRN